MSSSLKKVFNFLLFVVFAEIFGDSITHIFPFEYTIFDSYTKQFITLLFLILFIFGIKKIPKLTYKWLPFWLILFVFFYGLILGIILNKPINAINDFSSYIAFLLLLVVINFKSINIEYDIFQYIKYLLIIILIKLLLNQFFSVLIFGTPSWKVLFKASPVLLIPYSIFLNKILKEKKIKFDTSLNLLLILFFLIIAVARMIFIAMILISMVQFFRNGILRSPKKVFLISFFFILAFSLYFMTQYGDDSSSNIFGHIYGGDIYQEGMDYRLIQFNIIISRFVEYPLTGVGFGAFTKGYLTYEDLAKPYLLELDILNFFSKIGIIISLIYISSYYILWKLINNVIDIKIRDLFISFFLGLIGLLVYSTGQTLHQGYLFWICLSLLYGYLIIQLKRQKQ